MVILHIIAVWTFFDLMMCCLCTASAVMMNYCISALLISILWVGKLFNGSTVSCGSYFKCPNYYCLHWKLVCDGAWDCPWGTDETSCLKRDCPGMFPCPSSSICILASNICDSIKDCPHLQDEIFCDVRGCPDNCK